LEAFLDGNRRLLSSERDVIMPITWSTTQLVVVDLTTVACLVGLVMAFTPFSSASIRASLEFIDSCARITDWQVSRATVL
jgi:hypothetical protein